MLESKKFLISYGQLRQSSNPQLHCVLLKLVHALSGAGTKYTSCVDQVAWMRNRHQRHLVPSNPGVRELYPRS